MEYIFKKIEILKYLIFPLRFLKYNLKMSTSVESRPNGEEVPDDWETAFLDPPEAVPIVSHANDVPTSERLNWWGDSDDEDFDPFVSNHSPLGFPEIKEPVEEEPKEIIQIRTKKSFADKIEKVKDLLVSKRNFIDEVQVGLSHGGKISLKHHNIAPFGDIKLFLTKAKIYAAGCGKQQNLSQLEAAYNKVDAELRIAIANVRRIEQNGVKVPECDLKRVIELNAKVSEKKATLERAKSEAESRKGMKKNEDIKEILQQFVDLLNRDSSDTSIFLEEFQSICGIKSGAKKEMTAVKTKVVTVVKSITPVAPVVAPVVAQVVAPVVAPVVAHVVAPKRSVFRGARF